MTEIILIRHGETAWNAERRLQGHLDIALNEAGLQQAKMLGLALKNEKIDALIVSDLQRARQTADDIASWQNLPVIQDIRLRERCFGGFEGMLYSELESRYPAAFTAWQNRDPDAQFPEDALANQGESLRTFHQRCIVAIRAYAQLFAGKTIALVAHGGVLESAYREAKQLPLNTRREVGILNASINRFTVNAEQFRLNQWGDIAHLSEDFSTQLNNTESTAQPALDEI
jgi:probable phosphoglycerate mutase